MMPGAPFGEPPPSNPPLAIDHDRAVLLDSALADSGEEGRAKKLVRQYLRTRLDADKIEAEAALAALPKARLADLKSMCGR